MVHRGICIKCGATDHLTQHHAYPLVFFGQNKRLRQHTVILCETCHHLLEATIGHEEGTILKKNGNGELKRFRHKREPSFYMGILKQFLNRSD